MDRQAFWKVMEGARKEADELEELPDVLEAKITKLTKKEIEGFARVFRELMIESYDARLWAAASLINGGCSDDGFEYFRCWLIAQGERTFMRALEDPDSLADVVSPTRFQDGEDCELEELLYVAGNAYEAKAEGEELPCDPRDPNYPSEPRGDSWEHKDLPRLFPRLTAITPR